MPFLHVQRQGKRPVLPGEGLARIQREKNTPAGRLCSRALQAVEKLWLPVDSGAGVRDPLAPSPQKNIFQDLLVFRPPSILPSIHRE